MNAFRSPVTWRLLRADESCAWNARLRAHGASFHQFPDWNQAMQSWRLRITDLVCEAADGCLAFVSVQSLGWGRARVGIVREGPVWLRPASADEHDFLLRTLADGLRALGFVAVCFAHRDGALLERIASVGQSTREPLIPFTIADREALLVSLAGTDEELLRGFAPVARRNIRQALAAGYAVEESGSARDLRRAWPLWKRILRRQNVYHRSRTTYARLLRRAGETGFARLFLASQQGRAVQAILVVNAGAEATYIIGALDREALAGAPSPSCLLHWRAMQAARDRGSATYDLGSRSGPVQRFKNKFRPREVSKDPPVCLVLEPALFPLCRWLLPRLR